MADPFSIVAGTLGIIDVTSRFVQYMSSTGAAAANLDDDLRSLLHEFKTLNTTAQSIRDVCTPEVLRSPGTAGTDPDRLEDLRRDAGRILVNCERVLKRMERHVRDIIGSSWDTFGFDEDNQGQPDEPRGSFPGLRPSKRLDRFRVQLRKQTRASDFLQLRQQLSTSQTQLAASLGTIHL